jgi:spore maturation protein CgeB
MGQQFDLCHVDCGEWVTSAVVAMLKRHAGQVINYCIDDPTGPRDGRRFSAYRQALRHYDLVVVMRDANVKEAQQLGAKHVYRVFMSADELSHAPRALSAADLKQWSADVLFLGTWMPERGPFMLALVRAGVPLTIQGAHWNKAPEWPELSAYWRGGPIGGDDYAKAIQCARINLGLLSKGNRDMHTTRSMEIPALGGLLCAERTPEHLALYQEGVEAVFWEDADECAAVCRALLKDEMRCQQLMERGHQRYLVGGYANEAVLQKIMNEVDA